MNTVFRGILVAGAVVLGMSGCASQQYVDEQFNASEARIGALEENVGTLQREVAGLKQSDAVQTEKLERLSETAKEALSRAQEAGNLAKGRFLYEIRLDSTVKFGFNEAALSPEAEAALDDFAARLKNENKDVFIEIQGHTDSAGPENYNLALGERRADAVKRYLHTTCGVPLARMSVISYGEAKPLANNSLPEGRAVNRCVVLVVME